MRSTATRMASTDILSDKAIRAALKRAKTTGQFLKRCSDVIDQRREEVIAQQLAAGHNRVDALANAELKCW